MGLPDKQRTFYFKYEDEFGEISEGNFTIICRLTLRERHEMELEKSRILGGVSTPTGTLATIALIAASLKMQIIDAPNWWKQSNNGFDLEDEAIPVKLYDKVCEEHLAWSESLIKATKKSTNKVEDSGSKVVNSGNGLVETK